MRAARLCNNYGICEVEDFSVYCLRNSIMYTLSGFSSLVLRRGHDEIPRLQFTGKKKKKKKTTKKKSTRKKTQTKRPNLLPPSPPQPNIQRPIGAGGGRGNGRSHLLLNFACFAEPKSLSRRMFVSRRTELDCCTDVARMAVQGKSRCSTRWACPH